mgnify:CR=1 FL=1
MQIELREVSESDLELIFAWRSNPEVVKYLPSRPETFTWEHHWDWWNGRKNRLDWLIQLDDGMTRPRYIGVAHIANMQAVPEVGLYIGEQGLWGRGTGFAVLNLLIENATLYNYLRLLAHIHKKNKVSLHMYEKAGFIRVGEGRNGQWLYEKRLR